MNEVDEMKFIKARDDVVAGNTEEAINILNGLI